MLCLMTIKNSFQSSDLPRERLFTVGSTSLADYELLALVIGFVGKENSVIDISKKLIKTYGGLKGLLQVNSSELLSNKYIGKSKAATLLAVNEIVLRVITQANTTFPIKVSSPQNVFEILRKDLFMKKRECLYLLSLDSRNNLIAKDLISVATINETLISTREVYRQALLRNAVCIVLAHNHPSNNATPSNEDLQLTEQIAQAGLRVGIKLIDHVIICDSNFCSIKSLNVFSSMEGGEEIESSNKTTN